MSGEAVDILIRSTIREIKNSLGRYLAILTIIALGVGFFAGLRVCRPMLVDSADDYFQRQDFHDFQLISTIGFSQDNLLNLAENKLVKSADGGCYEDVLISLEGNDQVFRAFSITENVNRLRLVSGRMPENPGECLVSATAFDDSILGQDISFSANNSQETLDEFSRLKFTVVGRATSPMYINNDMGTSPLGNGHISAGLYIDRDCFTADYFKEIYITLEDSAAAYSDEYDEMISAAEDSVTRLAEEQAQLRYKELVLDNLEELDEGRRTLDEASAELEKQKADAAGQAADFMNSMGMAPEENGGYFRRLLEQINSSFTDAELEIQDGYAELEEARQELDDIEEPSVYVLTRDENAGYAAFKQDSVIIEKISIVFPAFFFLVAALVCVTTMTRMVDEQRTQVGVWKAMGYDRETISLKYIIYAGSAGLIGSALGFFLCTYFIPMVFWNAYASLYNFTEELIYSVDFAMFVLSVLAAMLCTAGVGYYCCRRELREVPAAILRPKAPKNGKRIFLERIGWLWKRISFLHKVSLRNVLRYKQRFFLMILGVSGCTALLLTGFGVRDSIQNVTDYQYGEISLYDAEINFAQDLTESEMKDFSSAHDGLERLVYLSQCSVDAASDDKVKSCTVTAVTEGDLEGFLRLHSGESPVAAPGEGELILSRGIAQTLGLTVGDSIELTNDDFDRISLRVSGVFDNYLGNYLFVSPESLHRLEGEAPVNAAYAVFRDGADEDRAAAGMLDDSLVSRISLSKDMKNTVDSSFSSLSIVVLLIILCAGALAFIVLFNLININIGERIREIATIKVLGFYNRESSDYVFREVYLLTALGALLGLGFGKLLHSFVMAQIQTDGMCFDVRIAWPSYIYSLVLSFAFALLVRGAMDIKLKKINMSESLKSVE